MPSPRIPKVNALIQEVLSKNLGKELSLKPNVFLTIGKVDTTRDLRYTRVFISVYPESESHYVMKTLQKECYRLQKSLYDKLHMKPLPRLSFELDKTELEADKVEKLLNEIRAL